MMMRLAVRIVAVSEGQILLVRYRDSDGDWYTTPGGGVERGETLEEAFHREVSEELGITTEFGRILMMREVIADRLPRNNLPAGFHQLEVFVKTRIDRSQDLKTSEPDPGQTGLDWLPLGRLHDVRFFPASLRREFVEQDWPEFYYGNIE